MDARTRTLASHGARRQPQTALRAALVPMLPLARWLVRCGVSYPSFASALKAVFVEAARRELQAGGHKPTDSAVSVLSGVQRRDIRGQRGSGDALAAASPKSPSVASQVFTRWLADERFRDRRGVPMALPKTGDGASFETLAREVSVDVHPRTLLVEMERLGLVGLDAQGRVALSGQAFVPVEGFEEMAALFAANAADHLAAAVHNLGGGEPKLLEQSIFADGLTPASAHSLGELARSLWAKAFGPMVREAGRRCEHDAGQADAQMRMRFGVYYFFEPAVENTFDHGSDHGSTEHPGA